MLVATHLGYRDKSFLERNDTAFTNGPALGFDKVLDRNVGARQESRKNQIEINANDSSFKVAANA